MEILIYAQLSTGWRGLKCTGIIIYTSVVIKPLIKDNVQENHHDKITVQLCIHDGNSKHLIWSLQTVFFLISLIFKQPQEEENYFSLKIIFVLTYPLSNTLLELYQRFLMAKHKLYWRIVMWSRILILDIKIMEIQSKKYTSEYITQLSVFCQLSWLYALPHNNHPTIPYTMVLGTRVY